MIGRLLLSCVAFLVVCVVGESSLVVAGAQEQKSEEDRLCGVPDAYPEVGIFKGTLKLKKRYQKSPSVIYFEKKEGVEFPAPTEKLNCDQVGKAFAPRIVPVLVGTTVVFKNSDDFEHNVNSPDNETFDLANWGKDETREYTFKRPGVYTLLCKLHPEMVGYAVVVETPWFAVVDKESKFGFEIKGLPAGTYNYRIWNERMSPKYTDKVRTVTIEAGKTTESVIKP